MKTAKDYIIFPLDVPTIGEARNYVKLLSESVGMFKVGLELFIRYGPEIIKLIKDSGTAKIFLDLKLHDIPETVYRAMKSIAGLDVSFTTVHCGENIDMLKKAVAGGAGSVAVLGVTVLTSVSNEDIFAAGFRKEFSSDMSRLVLKRAATAKAAGCAGIVCSGLEVKIIKEHFGKNFTAVTPGIRPLRDNIKRDDIKKNDQKRVTTPAEAIRNGADYLVIGRPIRDAKDPGAAAVRIAKEIKSELK